MKVIGLTGGIGSGKSTVARIFEVMGVPVYYSDERAKAMYFLPEVKSQVVALLGPQAYLSSNEINKKFIADRIFSDTNLLRSINSIIHPAVGNDFERWTQQRSMFPFVLKESAILFETGIYKSLDATILVVSPAELRAKRIAKRDKLTEAEVMKRFESQMSDDQKLSLANYVIQNNEETSLIQQALNLKSLLEK